MKKLQILIISLLFFSLLACNSKKAERGDYPMFWTWLDYRPGMNFDSICAVMSSTGIDGVMLNAPTPDDYRIAIPIAKRHGIEVYAWLWTMNLEHGRDSIVKANPEWQSVNRKGESLADTRAYVDYYKFMCPALSEVREFIKKKVTAYCEIDGLNGIAIDYHRFVDVILPTTLWSRYGIIQDKEYPEFDYGYHPEMIKLFQEKYGYDPHEQEDPSSDEKWLQFRCDQITEVANMIAEVVHAHGKVMAASPFPTPKMARKMVRQDWGKWNLDIVFPMVYHNYYTGDVSFISDCSLENVRDKNPMTTLYCGMTATNGPAMFECMDAALKNGSEGIAIFTVNSLRSPEIRQQFKTYADSARTARSLAKGQPKPQITATANSDAFQNKGIMDAINLRMKAYLSLANAYQLPEIKKANQDAVMLMATEAMQVNKPADYISRLSAINRRNPEMQPVRQAIADQFTKDQDAITLSLTDYTLDKEYGYTKNFKVTDQNSNVTFDVIIYLYGGIISGWSVEPVKETFTAYSKTLARR